MRLFFFIIILISLIAFSIKNKEEVSSQTTVKKKSFVMNSYQKINNQYSDIPQISIKELKDFLSSNSLKNNFVLVDTRTKEEILISKIPGAITKTDFYKNQRKYKNKIVIAYCTIGYRSGKFVKSINNLGFKGRNLEGSILGWIHYKGTLVDSSGKTVKKVHTYSKKWNLLPDGYKPIW